MVAALLFSAITSVKAQPEIHAEVLHYKSQKGTPYLDLQFRIPAHSVSYPMNDNDKYQASLLVNITMLKGADTVYHNVYQLLSPEQIKPGGAHSLIDMKVLPFKPGLHQILLKVTDQHSGISSAFQKMVSNASGSKLVFSNIMLVDKYTPVDKPTAISRSNLEIIPRLLPLLKEEEDYLTFYTEYYGSAEQVQLSILNSDSQYVMKQKVKCVPYGTIKSVLFTVPIDGFQGDYELNLSSLEEGAFQWTTKKFRVINSQNPTIFTKDLSYSTLKLYTKYLYPIAQGKAWDRLDSVMGSNDSTALKIEFYQFWLAQRPDDPELGWKNYLDLVVLANKNFTIVGTEGYLTDRGRIYLKYGKPVDISEHHDDPNTYPFEVWHYYNIGLTGRAEFVFANMAFNANHFSLIHSTAPGEPSNTDWKNLISRGTGRPNGGWGSDWE